MKKIVLMISLLLSSQLSYTSHEETRICARIKRYEEMQVAGSIVTIFGGCLAGYGHHTSSETGLVEYTGLGIFAIGLLTNRVATMEITKLNKRRYRGTPVVQAELVPVILATARVEEV